MSHADQSPAREVVTATRDSLRADAEELRRQIGSENMNQSGVIASRRLDEALLRLDLAAGRERHSGSSISSTRVKVTHSNSQPRRPRSIHSAPASDLELDESIAQSSAVWLEPTDPQGTRYRLDPAPARTPALQRRNKQSEFAEPLESSEPVQRAASIEQPKSDTAPSVSAPKPAVPPRASFNAFADLFTAPIDVMVSSDPSDRADTEREQIVTSVPESKWKPTVNSPEPTEAVVPEENSCDLVDEVQPNASVQPVADVAPVPTPAAKSDLVEPAPIVVESPPVLDEVVEEVRDEAIIEEFETPVVATESTQQLRPFQATWQVEEFIVPSTVDELFLAGSIAEQLAARLATARTDGLHTIAVTSPKPGEGRSTVAMGMALSVAFSGLRVALVDADPEGVKLATDLQLDLESSWLDAIRTDLPLEETAVFSEADSLTLIPLLESDAGIPMNLNELRSLLGQLKTTFDLVIVDCGASAVSEVTLCDTALIVRDVHRTKALEVETLAMSLRRNGLQGIGVVENFCPQ